MGTLKKATILCWVLACLPEFESASVFRRSTSDDGSERIHQRHRVLDYYHSPFQEKTGSAAVYPSSWTKAASTSTTPPTGSLIQRRYVDSIIDLNFPNSQRIRPIRVSASKEAPTAKKGRKRRRQHRQSRPRRTSTTPIPRDGAFTPTILTQLHTASAMVVTRNVTSTRMVTRNPFDFQKTIVHHPLDGLASLPTTTPSSTFETTTFLNDFDVSTLPYKPEEDEEPSFTTLPPTPLSLDSTTSSFFEADTSSPLPESTTFYANSEALRSPKKISDTPSDIELLNPFSEDKEIERIPREEEGDEEEEEGNEGDYEGEKAGQYHEDNPGQYHEINPGQYHEINPGQYYESNPGQYHETRPGQYVHHHETEEGNPTTIQIRVNHGDDDDKKVYNVQSKVDEFIIGEYGTISKSSGQTLQGVRYTAIGESVDSKLIYDTLIKFFNFQ